MKRVRTQVEPNLENGESTWKKRKIDNQSFFCIEHDSTPDICENCESVMSASKANHVHCLTKLLVQCEKAENSTRNALFHAIGQGYVSCVRLLLDFDAGEVNSIQQSGIAPLHMSAGAGHVEIMRELIKRGADVHMRLETDQLNPLHICASFGAVDCLELLLENGVDPLEQTSDSSMNALHFAAYHGNIDCIRALLKHNCDINSVSISSKRSVLHYAMCQGKFECFSYLVEQGADLSLLDINGHSALLCAPLKESSLLFDAKKYFSLSERRKWFTFALLDEEQKPKVFKTKRIQEENDSIPLEYLFQEIQDFLAGCSSSKIFERLPIFEFSFEDEIGRGLGVMREWFQLLEQDLLSYSIFEDCPNRGTSYFTKKYNLNNNNNSATKKENSFVIDNNDLESALLMASITGAIFAIAFIYGNALPINLPIPVYKMLLGLNIIPDDLQYIDNDFYQRTVKYLRNCTPNELKELDLTFTQMETINGKTIEINLIENGANVEVTKENLEQFLNTLTMHKLFWGRREIIDKFVSSFHSLIPKKLLVPLFTAKEFSDVLLGEQKISVSDWRKNTQYENCDENTKEIKWFWNIISSYSQEQKQDLLSFCSGAKHLPIGGFKRLAENPINAPFTIILQNNLPEGTLPTARTCFNTLVIPEMNSANSLSNSLSLILEAQNAGVGFAFV